MTKQERLDALKVHVDKAQADWQYALTHACMYATPSALEEFNAAQARIDALNVILMHADAEAWNERQLAKERGA